MVITEKKTIKTILVITLGITAFGACLPEAFSRPLREEEIAVPPLCDFNMCPYLFSSPRKMSHAVFPAANKKNLFRAP